MKKTNTPASLAEFYGLDVNELIIFLNQPGRSVTANTPLNSKLTGLIKKNFPKIQNWQTENSDAVPPGNDPIVETAMVEYINTNTKADILQSAGNVVEAVEIKYARLPRVLAAAKEFNIGQDTIIDFLIGKGFDRNDLKPTAKLTEAMYAALLVEFSSDKAAKMKSDQLILPKGSEPSTRRSKEEDEISFKKESPALRMINVCLTNKNSYLDLGNCGLTDEDFSNTEISARLNQCIHLESLVLSNEWFSLENGTKVFQGSVNSGRKNQINYIPKVISELSNLKSLILSGDSNQLGIRIHRIEKLDGLENLEILDLSNNQIEKMKGIEKLENLKHLNLSKNSIRQIDCLDNLTQLTELDLSGNLIEAISGLKGQNQLKYLDLSYNVISETGDLSNLIELEYLNMAANEITRIQSLDNLEKLKIINLNENRINDLTGLETLVEKDLHISVQIGDNPVLNRYQIKVEREENHLPFIKELLLRQLDSSQKSILVYPLKILVLGNHASGKSSLVNYLSNAETTGSTHILRIENYYVSKRTLKSAIPDAIFYDFGGQDFYHGLYQAFVSKGALHIILFNRLSDKNFVTVDSLGVPIINFDRRYWLGQKTYQEHGSDNIDPFIIVQSYADLEGNLPDHMEYPKLSGFKNSFFLSLEYAGGNSLENVYYEKGKEYFRAYFNNLLGISRIATEEPRWYIDFLKFVLNKQDKDFSPVKVSEIIKHYKAKDLSDADRLESLKTNLVTLHRHGLVLYYPNIKELDNYVWLNPEALVKYIQTEILARTATKNKGASNPGVIPRIEFESLVSDDKTLLLLKEQKVIFLHRPTNREKDDEYIIPNYLKLIDKNSAEFQLFMFGISQPGLFIKFNDFIPFGFINQMICFFGKEPDVKKFWRTQLLFTLDKNIRVLIEIDFTELMIKIHYQSASTEKYDHNLLKEYLFYSIMALYWNVEDRLIPSYSDFLVLKVHGDIDMIATIYEKDMKWTELQTDPSYIPRDLYISLDGKRFVSYIELFQLPDEIYKVNSYSVVDNRIDNQNSKPLSLELFVPFTNKKLFKMKKIFVSYSKYDESYLEDFEDHLITLKQEGVVTFNCKKIEFGKEWDEEIKKQIDECDIMVCLVSVKFLNTDYITRIEIKKAIEQNKIIVPIIIKACDWEGSALGKYQAAQRGKIVSLDNYKRLAGEIRAHSPEERAAFWTDVIKEFRTKLLVP